MAKKDCKPKKQRVVPGKPRPSFYWFWRYLCGWAIRLVYWVRVENAERLPKTGRVILCGNHQSMMDPVLMVVTCPRQISFIAKKSLFGHFLLDWFLPRMGAFPVDREGMQLSAIRTAISVLSDERALGIFPEGTRSKDGHIGKIFDGIGMIAAKAHAPILPVAIISKGRKPRPFSMTVIRLGELLPVPGADDDNKEAYTKMTQEAMAQVSAMLEQGR